MSITAEQKADIGNRYLAAIQARTKIRVDAKKKKADAEFEALKLDLNKMAVDWLKKHKLGEITEFSVQLDSCYRSGPNILCLQIKTPVGDFEPARSMFPAITTHDAARTKLSNLRGELCAEIEFLHTLVAPSRVAEFQIHASRLWAPESKAVFIGEVALRQLIEGFVDAKRTVTCKIG